MWKSFPSLPCFHAFFLLPSLSPSLPLSLSLSLFPSPLFLVKIVRIHQQKELPAHEESHSCVTAFIYSVLVLFRFTDIFSCLIKDRSPNLCHILVYKIFCLSCSIYWDSSTNNKKFISYITICKHSKCMLYYFILRSHLNH